MATTQTVNIDINANTQGAEQSVDRLENSIKTLDGAINLVGGSIEVLAGGLAITGAVTEEQAEKFQAAAVGAIALADGSKRMIEGFKTLATETKVLTTVQKVYNTVLKANPIFLLVGVLAAVTLGIVAFTSAMNKQKTSAEKATEALDAQTEALAALNTEQRNALTLATAQGKSQEEILEIQLQQAKDRKDAATDARVQQQIINQFSKETKQARVDEEQAIFDVTVAEEKLATFRRQAAEKAAQDRENERLANTTFNEETIELKSKELTLGLDIDQQLQKSALRTANVQRQTVLQRTEVEKAEAAKRLQIAQAEEAAKQALLTSGIDNIQGALSALFGENKAIASANVLIDAAQAGVGIIKNSQTTGPFAIAYQATQFALLAATTIASLRQINAAEPDGGGGTPNIPRSQAIPSFGTPGFQTTGGGTQTLTPSFGAQSTPIRAYVVTGDVTTGMEAEAQIQNRRTFGPG